MDASSLLLVLSFANPGPFIYNPTKERYINVAFGRVVNEYDVCEQVWLKLVFVRFLVKQT